MKSKPHPKKYSDLDVFSEAMVSYYVDMMPKVMNMDDYFEAKAKKIAIRDAEEAAREEAFDLWDNWVDVCQDRYERGVGPAWD